MTESILTNKASVTEQHFPQLMQFLRIALHRQLTEREMREAENNGPMSFRLYHNLSEYLRETNVLRRMKGLKSIKVPVDLHDLFYFSDQTNREQKKTVKYILFRRENDPRTRNPVEDEIRVYNHEGRLTTVSVIMHSWLRSGHQEFGYSMQINPPGSLFNGKRTPISDHNYKLLENLTTL